jgi:hypothetical protein
MASSWGGDLLQGAVRGGSGNAGDGGILQNNKTFVNGRLQKLPKIRAHHGQSIDATNGQGGLAGDARTEGQCWAGFPGHSNFLPR